MQALFSSDNDIQNVQTFTVQSSDEQYQGITSDAQTEGKQCLKLYLHKCVATDVKKFI